MRNEEMTATLEQIKTEMAKLTAAQRQAIRHDARLGGRTISYLSVEPVANAAQVSVRFENNVTHWFTVGARGAIRNYETTV